MLNNQEWLNEEILYAIKQKLKYSKTYTQHSKKLKNSVNGMIHKAKKEHLQSVIQKNKDKNPWKVIKKLTSEHDNTKPISLITSTTHISDPTQIVNELNSFFITSAERLLPETNGDFSASLTKLKEFVSQKIPPENKFVIPSITEQYVFNYLSELDTKKSTGLEGLLNDCQSGFLPKHSCFTALTKLTEKWLSEIHNKDLIGAVMIDFKKAFDLINHENLIKKLKIYSFGDTAIKWMTSYLLGFQNTSQVNLPLS